MTNIERFIALLEQMRETYKKKNHDYGDSFGQSLDRWGLIAAIVRISDKFNRLDSLKDKAAKVNESLIDTLLDMANYCVMTASWLMSKEDDKPVKPYKPLDGE